MSAPSIEINASLPLPPVVVRDAAMRVFEAIDAREPRYRDLTLSISLRVPGAPQVSVPIEAHLTARPQRWEAAIHIEASTGGRLFPTFDGTVSVTPDGGKNAELWLQGTYKPPGGALGEGLNATVMRGNAEESLRQFLNWLAGEVSAEVERSERERLEQARHYHG